MLKTDHINVTFTGKVLRWNMYLQVKDFDLYHVAGKEEYQFVSDALSRYLENASVITSIYSLTCASLVSGLM